MKELEDFKKLVLDGKYLDAVKYLNDRYFDGDTSYELGVYDDAEGHHAKTRGTGDEQAIIFNTLYLKRIIDCGEENKEAIFAKIISTLRHERVHIAQRADANYKDKSTKAEREFMAYSEELIPLEGLPPLSDGLWKKTYDKACDNFKAIEPSATEKYAERKALIDSFIK